MDYQGLLNSFKRGLYSPVYLLYGSETYLRDEIISKFKKNMVSGDTGDFNMDIVEGHDTTQEDVVTMANTLPFMADKRLIIVKNAEWFESKKKNNQNSSLEKENSSPEKESNSDKVLLDYLNNPPDTACLVFVNNSIDKRKKTCKTIEKVGQIVEFLPLKGSALNEWISGKVHKFGKKITPEAMDKLITSVGSNLNLLEKELEKMVLFINARDVIDINDVNQMVSKTVESSIFDLLDAVGERRFKEALQLTKEMLIFGEPPVKILYMIVRQFRIIYAAKVLAQQGYPEKQIAGKIKVHPYVVQKSLRQGKNFSQEELNKALAKLLEFEEAMKTGKMDNVMALERLIIGLCS